MNTIDAIIVLILVLALLRGAKEGFSRLGLSLIGFFIGLFAGSWLARQLAPLGHDSLMRLLIVAGTTLGLASLLSGFGELVGAKLRRRVVEHKLEPVDGGFGAVLETVSVLIIAWLIASVLGNLPLYGINSAIHNSYIISTLDRTLPPAPGVIAGLENLIEPNGFPRVFIGPEPALAPVQPGETADVRAALNHDYASVVKIEGYGCGGIVEGSGFVAESGYVITNAHVVAGVHHPAILDHNGSHQVTVVWFDPNLDIAVLRADHLAGSPLAMSTKTYPRNTAAVVLGYPGGGPLRGDAAVVAASTVAVGRNIYNAGITSRDIYDIEALVQPGNSGGPLVLSDGTVIGVVFASSVDNDNVGYALQMPDVVSALHQAEVSSTAVNTGGCAAD